MNIKIKDFVIDYNKITNKGTFKINYEDGGIKILPIKRLKDFIIKEQPNIIELHTKEENKVEWSEIFLSLNKETIINFLTN